MSVINDVKTDVAGENSIATLLKVQFNVLSLTERGYIIMILCVCVIGNEKWNAFDTEECTCANNHKHNGQYEDE